MEVTENAGACCTCPTAWTPCDLDLEILRLLSRGHTAEVVARRVELSARTVRRRLRMIADDIGVDSTIEAVVYAVRADLI
jgi:DNA-binding NarL/FixJ family response regulator